MFHPTVLLDFMYFPKDKSEYIPALISFSFFLLGAILTMRWIIVKSKRDAKKAKELEDRVMKHHSQKEQ